MSANKIHVKLIQYAIGGACLAIPAWHLAYLFPLIFVAFVPLFLINKEIISHKLGSQYAWLYGFIYFFLFNAGTTWWIWNASEYGAIMALLINTTVMNLPFIFMHLITSKNKSPQAIWSFIWLWLAMEYIHQHWEVKWPWLILGNAFAKVPNIVQWYEYTGVAGGSLWVLWCNRAIFLLYLQWNNFTREQKLSKGFHFVFFKIFTPLFLSYWVLADYREFKNGAHIADLNVVVVQPNIDPYKDKFNGMTPEAQTEKMLKVANAVMDSTVQLVAFPETSLVGNLNERDLQYETTIHLLNLFRNKWPATAILTGADTYKEFMQGEEISSTARVFEGNRFYDVYNTALFIAQGQSADYQFYHKSILVPGVERMPFAGLMKHVEWLTINLGGTSGSLGMDKESKNFPVNNYVQIAPIICYESVFPEYVASYVKKGANLLCVITNDGWWGNTPGYRQHMNYASLRAIENRRFVARSANTGISGFIDDEGNVLNESSWWTEAALKYKVSINQYQTFFTRNGDWLSKWALIFSCFYLIMLLTGKFLKLPAFSTFYFNKRK